MKFPIAWHKDCAKNCGDYIQTERARLLAELDKLEHNSKHLDFYNYQIACAEKEGKVDFDREKYKVKTK